jgi:dihydrofolate reductase
MNMKPKITIIAAMGNNGEIGFGNKLPWHIPEDLKFFKEKTAGGAVVMGWNTFKSIGKPLQGRFNIVLSELPAEPVLNVTFARNLEDAYQIATLHGYKEIFNIGGAKTYQDGIKDADKLILTKINSDFGSADKYFPKFDSAHYKKTFDKTYIASGYQLNVLELVKQAESTGVWADLCSGLKAITSRKIAEQVLVK